MAKANADYTSVVIAAVSGVLGIAIGGVITGIFNHLNHQSDLNGRMIELSVGVLRAEPAKGSEPLREWAIDVLQKRGEFSFTPQQRLALLNRELPFRGSLQGFAFPARPDPFVRPPESIDPTSPGLFLPGK